MKSIHVSLIIEFIIIFSGTSYGTSSSENEKAMLYNQPSVIDIKNYIESKRKGENATEDKTILQNIENKKRDRTLLSSLQEYQRSPVLTERIEELDNKHGIPRVKRTQRINLGSIDDEKDKDENKEDDEDKDANEENDEDDAKDEDVNKKEDEEKENDDPFKKNKYIYIPVRARWKIRSKKKIPRPQKPVQEMAAPPSNCETKPGPEAAHQEHPVHPCPPYYYG